MFGSKFYYLFISLSILSNYNYLNAQSEGVKKHYKSGLEFYQNREYTNAKSVFLSILENNWESPQLYYNLGNTFYRLGNIPGSIWSYEMCLLHNPNHSDAKFNLKLANINVKDRIAIPDPPIYLKIYNLIKERFSTNRWLTILLIISILYFSIVLIQKLFVVDLYLDFFKNLFLIIFLITMTFFTHSFWSNSKQSNGIIYKKSVNILSEPNTESTTLFQVHEGLKVSIKQTSRNWLEIELLDGKSGWLSKEQIKIIN